MTKTKTTKPSSATPVEAVPIKTDIYYTLKRIAGAKNRKVESLVNDILKEYVDDIIIKATKKRRRAYPMPL